MFYILNPFEKLHTFFCESLQHDISSSQHIDSIHMALSISYQKTDIIIYVIHPLYILKNQECKQLFQKINTIQCKTILYVSEPLTLLYDQHAYRNILKTYRFWQLWTYTKYNFHILKYMSNPYISIHYIPPNPFSTYFRWIPHSQPSHKKNTDQIVWIGNMTPSRSHILQSFGNQLIHFTNLWNLEDWIKICSQYQYFINIHRIPKCKCFETFRITPILANGGIVISEEINEEEMKEWNSFPIFFEKREKLYELWKKIQKETINISLPSTHSFTFHYKQILGIL